MEFKTVLLMASGFPPCRDLEIQDFHAETTSSLSAFKESVLVSLNLTGTKMWPHLMAGEDWI
jgi:hypothetical protein